MPQNKLPANTANPKSAPMSRPAPQPFDPDALARGYAADITADEVGTLEGGMMLSDLLKQHAAELPEAGPGTSTPLDNRRKGILSQTARTVWLQLKARGAIDELETLEAFRGRVSIAACGRRIRCATVGDFKTIQAAFLREAGKPREAAKAAAKAVSTARDIAWAKLCEAIRRGNFTMAYAEGIAARVYKRALASLKANELWSVSYTLRNNANARDGKGKASNRFKKLKAARAAKKSA